MMTVQEFAERCGGTVVGVDGSKAISGFATDSREAAPGALFLCIKGENVDGHDFATQAIGQGAVACVSEKEIGLPSIVVPKLVDALAKFANSKREEFSGPVIGVTGSTGKTTTKEFIAIALSPLGSILKNPGNRNSEYTSPLVWADLDGAHKAVVIEMGMRGHGQIAHLASFTKPTIGVVTHIGTAHIEKVGSREGIVRAKSELLQSLPSEGTAVLWQEDDYLVDLKANSPCAVKTFGFSPDADCRVLGYRSLGWDKCIVRGELEGTAFEAHLPTTGKHQALNATCAVLTAHIAGVDIEAASESLAGAELPPLRLQVVPYRGATVVLDTYNASPDSTVAAIKTLSEVPASGRKLAVLGEMKELGDFTESGHRAVGRALAESSIERALLTGGPTRYIALEAKARGFSAEKLSECEALDLEEVRRFLEAIQEGDVVLVKGSRALGLEKALEVTAK